MSFFLYVDERYGTIKMGKGGAEIKTQHVTYKQLVKYRCPNKKIPVQGSPFFRSSKLFDKE
jgi:hypothetical protein